MSIVRKSFLSSFIVAATFFNIFAINIANAAAASLPVDGSKITVMAYNTENFFDNLHDANHNDETYFPLAYKEKNKQQQQALCTEHFQAGTFYYKECMTLDWSDEVIATKMTRVADTILNVNNIGPDILIMEEVENLNILHTLNSKYLNKAGYQTEVILQGDDVRGINVAFLSRFPMATKPQIHRIPFTAVSEDNVLAVNPEPKDNGQLKTRGILQVDLLLPSGQILTVFGVHLPSQGHPTPYRKQAVDFINKLQKSLPAGRASIVGGDFNITAPEDSSSGLVKTQLASQWSVSHMIGCKDCEGTEVYKSHWSFLDILGFSKELAPNVKSGLHIDPASIKVINNGRYQSDENDEPARFGDGKSSNGVSDHFPIYGELVY